jgi:hypothetical protein
MHRAVVTREISCRDQEGGGGSPNQCVQFTARKHWISAFTWCLRCLDVKEPKAPSADHFAMRCSAVIDW